MINGIIIMKKLFENWKRYLDEDQLTFVESGFGGWSESIKIVDQFLKKKLNFKKFLQIQTWRSYNGLYIFWPW